MNDLIRIKFDEEQPKVSARELHQGLGIEKRFSAWFETNSVGFIENQDFTSVLSGTVVNNGANRELQDYSLSVEMAKHLCLMSRTEKGREFRQYFIDLEKAWNTPEKIMERALIFANKSLEEFKKKNIALLADNQMMKPKAEYFDALVDRKLLTNFRDTAKELGIKEKDFINFLSNKKYIYRDQQGKLKPYAESNKGLFEIKEFTSRFSTHAGNQTLITPKGRETFRLMINGIGN